MAGNMAGFGTGAALKLGDEALSPATREMGYGSNWGEPNLLPPLELLVDAYQKGWITKDDARYGLYAHGMADSSDPALTRPALVKRAQLWNRCLNTKGAVATVEDILQAFNRGIIGTENEARIQLRRNGVFHKAQQDILLALRFEIPGIADLARFAVRETFNVPLSEALKHYDELPPVIRQFFPMVGLGADLGFTINRDGGNVPATWADMFWAAHWTPLSPSQAYEMYQRLRPGRVQRYANVFPGIQPFTLDDLRRWLRVNEYPAGVRDQLAAIAYSPVGLRVISQALRLEAKDRDWAKEHLLDLGVSPADVDDVLDVYDKAAHPEVRTLERSYIRRFAARVDAAVKLGMMTDATAKEQLMSIGVRERFADALVADAALERGEEVFRAKVAAEKKAFLDGFDDEPTARRNLATFGMQPDAINDTISVWSVQHDSVHKTATASQVLAWFREGSISQDDAATRLRHLGYLKPDSTLLIAEAQRKIDATQAKAATAAAKTAAQQAKALQKLQQQAAKQAEQLAAKLCRMTPLSKMLSWLSAGNITPAYFQVRLRSCGYPDEVIALYLREATIESTRKAEAQKANQDYRSARLLIAEQQLQAVKAKAAAKSKVKNITAATVNKWYQSGIIDQGDAIGRLRTLGFPDDVIEGMMQAGALVRAKFAEKHGVETPVELYGIGSAASTGLAGP